jgi:hypothetical protein
VKKTEDDREGTKLELKQATSGEILSKEFSEFVQENVLSGDTGAEGEDDRSEEAFNVPWAYGKGWPWIPLSFIQARHALPFDALRVGHP